MLLSTSSQGHKVFLLNLKKILKRDNKSRHTNTTIELYIIMRQMQQHGRQPLSTLLLLLAHPRFVSGGEGTILAWHITDPHVDPFYTKGTPTEECYCRSHALCPERPSSASCTPAATAPDGNNGAAISGESNPFFLYCEVLSCVGVCVFV